MEMQILIFGIALPVAAGAIWLCLRILFNRRRLARTGPFLGAAIAATLLLSALSQESLREFPSQNKWLWFPIATLLLGILASVGGVFVRSRNAKALLVAGAAMLATSLLDIPEWRNMYSRLVLGGATTLLALSLAWIVRRQNDFATPLALGFALAATSVLAMLSGFAKLAVPVGAATFFSGLLSLLWFATRSWKPEDNCIGFDGAVVIAAIAALGCATAYGYDTTGIPVASWALASLAPLGLLLGELPAFRSRKGVSQCARIAGCVLLSAAAVITAKITVDSDRNSSAGHDAPIPTSNP